jgi:hypothetical protein
MKNVHMRAPSSFLTVSPEDCATSPYPPRPINTVPNKASRTDAVGKNVMNRILSILHGGVEVNIFTGAYCDFQLSFRLAILALICTASNPHLVDSMYVKGLEREIKAGTKRKAAVNTVDESAWNLQQSLNLVLLTLVTGQCEDVNARRGTVGDDLLASLKQSFGSSPDVFDGASWWSRGDSVRGHIFTLCIYSLDIIGAALSHFDRKVYHQNVELNSFFENGSQSLMQLLTTLPSSPNDMFLYTSTSTSTNTNRSSYDAENFFSTFCSSGVSVAGRSLLFESNAGTWRNEKKHATEGVIASMNAMNKGQL